MSLPNIIQISKQVGFLQKRNPIRVLARCACNMHQLTCLIVNRLAIAINVYHGIILKVLIKLIATLKEYVSWLNLLRNFK